MQTQADGSTASSEERGQLPLPNNTIQIEQVAGLMHFSPPKKQKRDSSEYEILASEHENSNNPC